VDSKRTFLAVYDYGMGGVWCVIDARSPDEIMAKYPELSVVDIHPAWMSSDDYARIALNRRTDIDDEPSGWFQALVEGRKPRQL
jgi:hypothetical protein